MSSDPLQFLGDYIDGRFVIPSSPDGEIRILSPADLNDHVITIRHKLDNVDAAVNAAQKAFFPWARLSLEERKRHLFKLKEVFSAHAEDMAKVISRETGKPLWEARTEAKALASKIDITINYSMKLVETELVKDALPGVDGVVRHQPRGVMAVVGPFNFPAHLPNGHIIPALLTGNTVVFKPSDKTPAVGQYLAQLFEKAEFPKGVFNMVQGPGNVGRRLVLDENVAGILFTGSYEVGLKIKEDTLNHFWKILALEMGGKNATVVWHDADLDKALYESLVGSFLTAGQRCSCTSRLIVHESIAQKFIEKFYSAAKKIKIGHWKEEVLFGPLISKDSVEKYVRFQEIAKREGAETLMRGKELELDYRGYYVTPSINLVKEVKQKSVYQRSEIFGPNVAVYTVQDFDEAMHVVNNTSYGLCLSVFTKEKSLYEEALLKTRVGLLNWNRTTNGSSSRLPFGGRGKSGNDRPSGHFAVQYCTTPVASLEDLGSLDKKSIFPGITLDE
ncbi:MAG: N-succinylglutamate 5-semialdehyde dehydrogenase [Proteobacteria bacterium SG_bin7]|nr:MAG: N-succinylglutamate 5-semialdehyde dehydrogenase [Proteobacteria bacterium SG_bin7]